MSFIRFLIFNLLSWIGVLLWGTAAIVVAPFGHRYSYAVARSWCQLVSFLVKWICGLTYKVEGKENFPAEACVLFIKHSSAFETFVQILEFPQACWVLKRELTWVPFFGWALLALRAIAIDRSAGAAAVTQVVRKGTERLEQGISVSVFPEGTRMPAGETKRYGISGTLLAKESGRLIVPIAHNAGYHWPRRARGIKPGVVTFVVGEPVNPADRDPREVNAEIQQWVEATVAAIVAKETPTS